MDGAGHLLLKLRISPDPTPGTTRMAPSAPWPPSGQSIVLTPEAFRGWSIETFLHLFGLRLGAHPHLVRPHGPARGHPGQPVLCRRRRPGRTSGARFQDTPGARAASPKPCAASPRGPRCSFPSSCPWARTGPMSGTGLKPSRRRDRGRLRLWRRSSSSIVAALGVGIVRARGRKHRRAARAARRPQRPDLLPAEKITLCNGVYTAVFTQDGQDTAASSVPSDTGWSTT